MIRILAFLLALLPAAAFAQSNSVRQSGNVSPRHAACWTVSGVIQDCTPGGDPALNLLGIYAPSPAVPFYIDDASITGPFNQLAIGYTATDIQITDIAYGGATHKPLQICVNGFCGITISDTAVSLLGPTIIGAAPTVAAGASFCGTAPVVAGNSNVFRIIVGTSTNGGTCPVTFSAPFSHPPVCVPVNETSGARGAFPATPTTTSVVITADSTFTAGDSIGVNCSGYN
jgi:hypothetical protein